MGRGVEITSIFCQDYTWDVIKRPQKTLTQKEKTQWSTSWARLPKSKVSIEPIVSKNLYANPINKVMSMEQIFQDISKQMLETTYTLKLGQLLKIAPSF
jgi:hypothetical protein